MFLSIALILAGIGIACSGSEPTSTPTATSAPASAPTELVPTSTSVPASTAPSATAVARPAVAAPTRVPTPEPDKPEPVTLSEDVEAKLDEYINAYVDLGFFSGSVLVAQGEDIILSKGYGMADYENGIPNTPQTKFNFGEITQSFTAMAIMQLQEEGLLFVGDPLSEYLPDFPNADSIALHHMLTYGSGIPHYPNLPGFEEVSESPSSVEELIDLFKDEPLDFNPGQTAEFGYTNWSPWVLLGAIIERLSGMSYQDYLKENIFGPLGMENSGYDINRPEIEQRAIDYTTIGDNAVKAPIFEMSNAFSAAGLYSTVEDLYMWDRALYTEELASMGSLDQVFDPHRDSGQAGRIGYGWFMNELRSHMQVWQLGGIGGFTAYISRLIDDDIVIIILSNNAVSPINTMVDDFASIMFGLRYSLPEARTSIELTTEALDAYVGTYEFQFEDEGPIITVSGEGDSLFVSIDQEELVSGRVKRTLPKFQIFPETTRRFFAKTVDVEIMFTKTDLGGVIGLIFNIDGMDLSPFRKLK